MKNVIAYVKSPSILSSPIRTYPQRCMTQLVSCAFPPLLGGSGDLVSSLIMGIIRVTIWVTGVVNLLTKSP